MDRAGAIIRLLRDGTVHKTYVTDDEFRTPILDCALEYEYLDAYLCVRVYVCFACTSPICFEWLLTIPAHNKYLPHFHVLSSYCVMLMNCMCKI